MLGFIGDAVDSVAGLAGKVVGPVLGPAYGAWSEAAAGVANAFAPGSKDAVKLYLKGVGNAVEHGLEKAVNVVGNEDVDFSDLAENHAWGVSDFLGGVAKSTLESAGGVAAKQAASGADFDVSLRDAGSLLVGGVRAELAGDNKAAINHSLAPSPTLAPPVAKASGGLGPALLVGALLLGGL